MKKAMILNIGNELLDGKVINTNCAVIGLELAKIGIETVKCLVVADNVKAIAAEISNFLNSDINLIITTGGLGPTADDNTKEAIVEAVGDKLVINDEVRTRLINYYGADINDYALKQAYFPKSARIIKNRAGTADGFIMLYQGKKIIALVGPPPELKVMLKDAVSRLAGSKQVLTAEFTAAGGSEADFAPKLKPITDLFPQITVNSYCNIGSIRYLIKGQIDNKNAFEPAVTMFKEIMASYIIGPGDLTIESVLVALLKDKKFRISFAESCTGGLLAAKLTGVAGASDVIGASIVTYSNEAKIKYLRVKTETLARHGAVSRETVREMVTGLTELTGSNVGIAVSGIAGPGGGTAKKPVGLVHYGIKIGKEIFLEKRIFRGERNLIRERAALWILYRLWDYLRH